MKSFLPTSLSSSLKKLWAFAILFIGLHAMTFAQTGKISGTVQDANNTGLEFINVVLRRATDSSIVKVATTDVNGAYEIDQVKAGTYYVQHAYIGYSDLYSPVFEMAEGESKTMSSVQMQVASETLNQVEVIYTRPIVEVQADKTIFNVEGTPNAIGLNALELLRKAPGIIVDNNENILIKGKGGIIVYIDGKLTPLDSDGLAQLLKNMQSSNIDSIEIITNPSAKYDAAGNAGIINIKLKKNQNFGTNGTLAVGYGIQKYAKYNTNMNVNHRNAKWNLFANYGNNWGRYWSYMDFYRQQNGITYDQFSDNYSDGLKHTAKAGADYTINSKSTVGVMFSGNFGENNWYSSSRNNISSVLDPTVDSVLVATTDNIGRRDNFNYNINYRFADTLGHTLGIDADYGMFTIFQDSYQPNAYFDSGEQIMLNENIYQNNTSTDISIASVKSDYEQNLWKGKLGLGFKSSLVSTVNGIDFYNVDNNVLSVDSSRTNEFNYDENINALYANYNRMFGKWGVQVGLRAEHTKSKGVLTSFTNQNDTEVNRDYLNIFPSAAVTYNVSEKNVFNLTYSRRIDRPSYQDLNPFEYRIDELSFSRGNEFLQPQYTDAFELSNTLFYMITTSISYARTEGFFTEITDTTQFARSYIQPRNLGQQDYYAISIGSPIPVKKWLNIYFNATGYRIHNKATFEDGKTIDLKVTSYNFYMQNTFTLPKKWGIELSGWISGPSVWGGTFKNRAMGGADIGLRKDFANDRATLRLSYGDLFRTMHWRGISEYGGLYMDARGGWESYQFRVNFTWKFGNQNMKAKTRTTGLDDLNKRVE